MAVTRIESRANARRIKEDCQSAAAREGVSVSLQPARRAAFWQAAIGDDDVDAFARADQV